MINCWTDGACDSSNPSEVLGAGSLIVHENGEKVTILTKIPIHLGTNNLAEYTALYDTLEYLTEHTTGQEPITIHTDAKLVMNQMNGTWRIKEGIYADEARACKKMLEYFKKLKIKWVPRTKNQEADALSKAALQINL